MEKIADRVDRTKDGDLVVKFAKTGVTKRFQRISVNNNYRGSAKNFSISAFLETEREGIVDLVFEAHDFEYDNTPKLRRCVVERFEDEATGNIALGLLTEALSDPAAVRMAADEEDDFSPNCLARAPDKRSRVKTGWIMFVLVSMLVGVAATVVIASDARSASGTARSIANVSPGVSILPAPRTMIGSSPAPYSTPNSSESCDGSEEMCITVSTQAPAQAMKTLADLVKIRKGAFYKLKVQLVEDDASNAVEKKE